MEIELSIQVGRPQAREVGREAVSTDHRKTEPCPAKTEGRCLAAAAPNCANLIRFSADFFSGTLSRQSLLHSALLARLQVVGVTLHFLNDVLRLHLALEATKGVLQRLTLLQSNFCQIHHPQTSPDRAY